MRLLTDSEVIGMYDPYVTTTPEICLIDTASRTMLRINTEDGRYLTPDAWRKVVVKRVLSSGPITCDLVSYGYAGALSAVFLPDETYFTRHVTVPPFDVSQYRLESIGYDPDTDEFTDGD